MNTFQLKTMVSGHWEWLSYRLNGSVVQRPRQKGHYASDDPDLHRVHALYNGEYISPKRFTQEFDRLGVRHDGSHDWMSRTERPGLKMHRLLFQSMKTLSFNDRRLKTLSVNPTPSGLNTDMSDLVCQTTQELEEAHR